MSDDLQAKEALDQTSPDDGKQSDSASAKAQDESEGREKQASKKERVNLQDFPEFRDFQSRTDQQRRELERAAQMAKEEAADLKKRLESLEDQAYGKDDYGKMQLAATRAAREAAAAKRELELYRAREAESQAKMQAVERVASKYDGITPADIMEAKEFATAQEYDDLHVIAQKIRDNRRAAKQAAREQDKEDNSPDLGGGRRASAPMTKLERDYDDAVKRKDSVAQMRILRQMRSTKT